MGPLHKKKVQIYFSVPGKGCIVFHALNKKKKKGFVNFIFSLSSHHFLSDGALVASPHLLYLPSHTALGCSFNLLPLYQSNPTGCLCKHNKRHGYTLGSSVKTALKKHVLIFALAYSAHPVCHGHYSGQVQHIKAHQLVGHSSRWWEHSGAVCVSQETFRIHLFILL